MQLATIDSKQKMSSREIADLTEKDHSNVMRDIRNMLEVLKKDALSFEGIYQDAHGRNKPCFYLDYDLTMTLVSGYSIPLRHKVVTRLSELEKPTITLPNFLDPAESAIAWAAEYKAKKEAQALVEQQRPAVEFVEKYTKAEHDSLGFRQVCKQLGANEARFREFLFDHDIMYRLNGDLMAYQNHIDAQRFEVKTKNFGEKNRPVCYFTGKGIVWVSIKWNESNKG